MPDKRNEILTALGYISDMLVALGYDIDIQYHVEDYEHQDEVPASFRHLHTMVSGDEYFLIRHGGQMLYAVNVTGDNVLTAIHELVALLARKCG